MDENMKLSLIINKRNNEHAKGTMCERARSRRGSEKKIKVTKAINCAESLNDTVSCDLWIW